MAWRTTIGGSLREEATSEMRGGQLREEMWPPRITQRRRVQARALKTAWVCSGTALHPPGLWEASRGGS